MPASASLSASGCSPAGHTSGSTVQSPSALRSSRRPVNHPSSSTNRSTPTRDAAAMSGSSLSSEWSKYTASHVFSVTGRAPRSVDHDRTHGCTRSETPSNPASEYTATHHGPTYRSPGPSTISPGAGSSPAPSTDAPSGEASAHSSVSPLHAACTAHTSPVRNPKLGVPAASRNALSCPPRPCRPSRACTPCASGRRIGRRSRPHTPLKSCSSVARAGIGSTDAARVTTSGPRPWFSISRRVVSTPSGVSSSGTRIATPASSSVRSNTTERPSRPATASVPVNRGARARAAATGPSGPDGSRETCSPGRPLHPSPQVGTSPTRSGTSIDDGATAGTDAAATASACSVLSSPRSRPQCSTVGMAVPRVSTRRLTPAARR